MNLWNIEQINTINTKQLQASADVQHPEEMPGDPLERLERLQVGRLPWKQGSGEVRGPVAGQPPLVTVSAFKAIATVSAEFLPKKLLQQVVLIYF